jgi:hypothetical protein
MLGLVNVSAQKAPRVRQLVNGFPDAIIFRNFATDAFRESAKEANSFLKLWVGLDSRFVKERL